MISDVGCLSIGNGKDQARLVWSLQCKDLQRKKKRGNQKKKTVRDNEEGEEKRRKKLTIRCFFSSSFLPSSVFHLLSLLFLFSSFVSLKKWKTVLIWEKDIEALCLGWKNGATMEKEATCGGKMVEKFWIIVGLWPSLSVCSVFILYMYLIHPMNHFPLPCIKIIATCQS